jgi:SAM-dependent methyltransferase
MTLLELLQNNTSNRYYTDKHVPHTYVQSYYDSAFYTYKNNEQASILEIGVLHGGSLNLWKDYFSGSVVGIDVFARVPYQTVRSYVDTEVELHTVDSFNDIDLFGFDAKKSRTDFFKRFENSKFDIIIDDGHHDGISQYKTYHNFKNLVKPGGLYIIEDIKPYDDHLTHVSKIENIEILDLRTPTTPSDNILGIIKF